MSKNDSNESGFRRRDFLALAPACVVTAGTLSASLAWADSPLGRLTTADPEHSGLVSIGYWLGSEKIASFDALTHTASSCFVDALNVPVDQATCVEPVDADLIGAESLQTGDQRFAETGAKISIHKLPVVDGQTIGAPPELSIDVHFTPFHRTPFHAWSTSPGSSIAFTVPLERSSGLSLGWRGPFWPAASTLGSGSRRSLSSPCLGPLGQR